MPTIQSAKEIAENALRTIGAFPATRKSPDPGELKNALRWLEMLLNFKAAVRPIGGFWQVFDIPLETGVGDYDLSDYSDERGVQNVYSVFLVNPSGGEPDPLEFMYESVATGEDLTRTGRPQRVTVTRDRENILRVFPEPTIVEQNMGLVLRVRVQTYHDAISDTGTGDNDLRLRASWYLWATTLLAYEIGKGPVRRLPEQELNRLQNDSERYESALLARDSGFAGQPAVTEPMDCSVDDYPCVGYHRKGYRKI